jgi:hypothetical protein
VIVSVRSPGADLASLPLVQAAVGVGGVHVLRITVLAVRPDAGDQFLYYATRRDDGRLTEADEEVSDCVMELLVLSPARCV